METLTFLGNTDSQQQDGDCLWRLAPTRKGCRTELVRETKQNLLPYISRYDVHPPTDSWTVTQPESPAEGPSTVTQSNPPPGLSHTDTLGEQGFRHELLLSEHHSPVFDEPLLHVQLDLESSEISFGSLSHWLLILLLETAPEPVHFPQVYEPHFSHHEPRPYVRDPKDPRMFNSNNTLFHVSSSSSRHAQQEPKYNLRTTTPSNSTLCVIRIPDLAT